MSRIHISFIICQVELVLGKIIRDKIVDVKVDSLFHPNQLVLLICHARSLLLTDHQFAIHTH